VKASTIAEALPADEPLIVDALSAQNGVDRVHPPKPFFLTRILVFVVGWLWRLAVGAVLCFNYFSSILVAGWTYRFMQGVALRGWWKQRRSEAGQSFQDFLESLGPGGPVARPRWLLREHIRQVLYPKHGPRKLSQVLQLPWHSLWLNFGVGFRAILCTYLLTGWGCLMMTASWEFGWVNSFNKGYEQALVGPLVGIAGILLFSLAMIYVPMAQVHQAVTGQARAFFDFRFVFKLIQARFMAYAFLAALTMLVALPLEILKFLPMYFYQMQMFPEEASDAEHLAFLQKYLIVCGLVLFLSLILLRGLAAVIYRSAVMKVLRRGRVKHEELHPVLANWFDRLDCWPKPDAAPSTLGTIARFTARWPYRFALYGLLTLMWIVFTAQAYVGQFVNYHPYWGFMNRPLVQFPCVDYVPQHLH